MGSVTPMPPPELRTRALSWPDRARAATVVDAASYQTAADLLLGIKDLRKEVAATFDPIIASWVRGHRESLQTKREHDAPLDEAEQIIKAGLRAFDAEQQRLAAIEQRRRDEEARQREEDERLARAAAMEIEGRQYGDAALVEEAHALLEQPPVPPVVARVMPSTPKVAGITQRVTYRAEVTNLHALITHIAAHPQLVNLLLPNLTALNAQARSLKTAMQLPGVRVVPETQIAAGRR